MTDAFIRVSRSHGNTQDRRSIARASTPSAVRRGANRLDLESARLKSPDRPRSEGITEERRARSEEFKAPLSGAGDTVPRPPSPCRRDPAVVEDGRRRDAPRCPPGCCLSPRESLATIVCSRYRGKQVPDLGIAARRTSMPVLRRNRRAAAIVANSPRLSSAPKRLRSAGPTSCGRCREVDSRAAAEVLRQRLSPATTTSCQFQAHRCGPAEPAVLAGWSTNVSAKMTEDLVLQPGARRGLPRYATNRAGGAFRRGPGVWRLMVALGSGVMARGEGAVNAEGGASTGMRWFAFWYRRCPPRTPPICCCRPASRRPGERAHPLTEAADQRSGCRTASTESRCR